MKILFLARSLTYGGAERQLAALATGLRNRGHQVSVALFYAGAPLESELRKAGVAVHTLDKSGRWDLAGFLTKLAGLVRAESPDVLHSYLVEPNTLAALLKPISTGTRVVWGIRSSSRDLRRYERFVRLSFRLQCLLSRHADLIVANSHAGRADHVANGFPPDRTVVVHNGFALDDFPACPDDRSRVRSEYRIGQDAPLIGVVARYDPMKDHPTFLRAAALICRDAPDVRFLCVGNGRAEYTQQMKSLAQDLGIAERVAWAPARPDIASVYRSLDLLVSSSCWGEGFSNVIAEAMACEVPIVATDVGDSRLIVGDTGLMVNPDDSVALAAAIRAMLAEPVSVRVERGRAARRRIGSEFSMEHLVQRTEEHLLRLIAEPDGTVA